MKNDYRLAIACALAAACSAWAAYRIHVLPIEQAALPILEAVLDFQGRAPDQYRILPYLLLGALHDFMELLPWRLSDLRHSVLLFDALFLFLSALALRRCFPSVIRPEYLWYLFLLYPLLMFDGYRPVTAFILYLSVLTVAALRQAAREENATSQTVFALMIVLMSFTRADVALLFAVAGFAVTRSPLVVRGILVIIPVLAQLLLARVIFPDAAYFSPLVMLTDNLSGRFLLAAPLTYLLAGLLVWYWRPVRVFVSDSLRQQGVIIWLAIGGYVLTLAIIARPNEYRLFLPLLPLILWLIESLRVAGQNQSGAPY